MVKRDYKYGRWLPRSLIGAGIAFLFSISIAAAAELKDVRIGDYDDFTRVVFEFSGPVAPQNIDKQEPGQVSLGFPDTQPDLIRKIPIGRSNRIDDAQLWQEGNGLLAVIFLTFDRFRFEYFTLNEPDRIAIDIFPLNAALTPETSRGDSRDDGLPAGLANDRDQADEAVADAPETSTLGNAQASPIRETPLEKAAIPQSVSTNQFRGRVSRTGAPPLPSLVRSSEESKGRSIDNPDSYTNRLQYYLVVGLVVITIVILALLVLMMLSRQKINDESRPLSAGEYLQRQDQTIASLNERIQEQLKRYDEA